MGRNSEVGVTLLAGPAAQWGSADETRSAEPQRFFIHGAPVEIDCGYSPLAPQIEWALGAFTGAAAGAPHNLVPISGSVQPYDLRVIHKYLSPTARRCAPGAATHDGDPLELYEEDERFWLVDERWGMTEINMLRGQWRSWALPEPKIDPVRCAERAVLWPLAQLLRGRGLHLLPAVSAVRDGWAVLIFGACDLGPELVAMMEAGYRVIGQRWTAIREEEGRIALLQMPGRVERPAGPRLAGTAGQNDFFQGDGWVDLTGQQRGSRQAHAFCDAVLSIMPGRRPPAPLGELLPSQALSALRQAWPIHELHPARRAPLLPGKLARHCRCAQAHLSRDPRDMLALLDALRGRSGTVADSGTEPSDPVPLESESLEGPTEARSQAA
jgi:hypothetical protein